jgi:predicted DNA-binding transcriptional regulator YafY
MSKSRILYVQKFLKEHTDEEHQATVSDIMDFLQKENIETTAKTIRGDIEQLIEIGNDIIVNDGNPKHYFCGNRPFEFAEILLLINATQASHFIPCSQIQGLIEKLSRFVSKNKRKELNPTLITDKNKCVETNVYNAVELLNTAKNERKKVNFKYRDWNPKGKKIFRHNGKIYNFSPFGILWSDDKYYSVGYCDSHEKIVTFRVDRMIDVQISEQTAESMPENFNLSYYYEKVVQMYDCELQDVTLVCENLKMFAIRDKFGDNLKSKIVDSEHFEVTVNVAPSPTFLAWVFTFGGAIKIKSPTDVVETYHKMLESAK